MALCLACCLLLAGCRKSVPPPQGWARLDVLLALNPNQAMVADIDHRLAALAAQRQHILTPAAASIPPRALSTDIMPLSALAEPLPFPPFDPQFSELRKQKAAALTRMYDRQRAHQLLLAQRDFRNQTNSEMQQAWAELDKSAERERKQISDARSVSLISADLSLETARRWVT